MGLASVNFLLCSLESKWSYVDDTSALFSSPDHAYQFKEYFPSKHPNINFFHRDRSNHPEVFCKKCVLKDFAKFTGKYLPQSLFFNKVY